MPGVCRNHTLQVGESYDPDNILFKLPVGETEAIFQVYSGMVLQTLLCPSNLTATQVAQVEMSPNYSAISQVGDWYTLYSSGNIGAGTSAYLFSFFVGAGRAVRLSPADFYGANWLRFTFNTAQLTSDAIFINVDGQVTGT